jgi:PAS domain-containing protein
MTERATSLSDAEGFAAHASVARMLVDAVADESVFLLDPLGRILSWNSTAERATGYSAVDVAAGASRCCIVPRTPNEGFPINSSRPPLGLDPSR